MTLPKSHIMERLSLAYVRAVVAAAGAHFNPEEQPEYGIDCTIKQVVVMQNGKLTYTGFPLMCQIKSTTDWTETPDNILYDIKVEAYNKLVSLESKAGVLVMLRLPKNEADWLKCNEDLLELRNCCYWEFLDGPQIENQSTKRIKFPRSQIFTPQAVNELLDRIRINRGSLA